MLFAQFPMQIPQVFCKPIFLGGFYKFALSDFGIIFEVNRLLTTVKSRRVRGEPSLLELSRARRRKAKSNCKLKRERSELCDRVNRRQGESNIKLALDIAEARRRKAKPTYNLNRKESSR